MKGGKLLQCLVLVFSGVGLFGQAVAKNESALTHSEKMQLYNSISIDSTDFGKAYPIFESISLEGGSFKNDTTRKIVFYNYWFTSCSPCVAEMPMFNRLVKQFSKDVDFIAFTFEEKSDVNDFLENNDFHFQHFLLSRSIMNKLQLTRGFPTITIVVDGVVVHQEYGGIPQSVEFFEERMNLKYEMYKGILESYLD